MTKSEILFGREWTSVNIVRLAPVMGVSSSTLYAWKKDPDKMPLWAVSKLVRLRKLSPERQCEVLRDVSK